MTADTSTTDSGANIQRRALTTLTVLLCLWALTFWSTLVSVADIWFRSDTYAHGALIPALSLWLIWRKRHELAIRTPSPYWPALAAATALILLWLLALAADVLVVEQLAATMLVPVIVILVMGRSYATTIAFPLGYLLFAVPFGEELTLPLQQITAEFTVSFLRLSGIPVFISGLFLEIPTGRFEVAEACSGIRYLIASLALGTLYAYLTYSSLKKRLLFILAAIIVPIVANGIRAYLIVLIAHLSEMKYATGVDHLIYGWLFFGVIIALMFWIGGYWQDPQDTPKDLSVPSAARAMTAAQMLSVGGTTIALLLVAQLGAYQLNRIPEQRLLQPIALELSPWEQKAPASRWQPAFSGADLTYQQYFSTADGEGVELFIASYQYESHGKELISSANRLHDNERWTPAGESSRSIQINGSPLPINVLELRTLNGSKRRVWSWYDVMGQRQTNRFKIKFLQALGKLTGRERNSNIIALAVSYDQSDQADRVLEQFLSDNWNKITATDLIRSRTSDRQAARDQQAN